MNPVPGGNSPIARHLMIICLAVCTVMFSSCDRGEKEAPKAVDNVPQQFSGTLPISIQPDNPCSLYDLKAAYSGRGSASFSWERNGELLKGETTANLARNNLARGDTITVTVRSGNETGSATVVIGNTPPHINSIEIDPAVLYTGVDINAKPDSIDPDGDDIRYEYRWFVNDQEIYDNSPVLKGAGIKRGDRVSLVVTPSDGEDKGSPFDTDVGTVSNTPPFFVSNPPDKFSGFQYNYRASAKDPDGDRVTYSLASAPGGMTIAPDSGLITWQVSKGDAGSHQIEVVASDSEGSKNSQTFSLDIR